MAVMAGLLAMHVLSASHTGSGSGTAHANGHVHTGDHHARDEPAPAAGAVAGPRAGAGMAEASRAAGDTLRSAVVDSRSTPPGARKSESFVAVPAVVRPHEAGHRLCPGATPGHCPQLPALMSMCQAILSSAGAALLLLLLLLLLGVVARRAVWTTHRGVRPFIRAPHGAVSTWGYVLRVDCPSLHELCISRV